MSNININIFLIAATSPRTSASTAPCGMRMSSRSTGSISFATTEADALDEQVLCYLVIASFTLYAYDWLLSASDEAEIVSRSGLSCSIAIYFLSRVSEFGHMLMTLIFALAPVGNCEVFAVMLATFAVGSIACTTFLFFLRVRAVYLQARYITVIFGALGLVTVAIQIFNSTALHPAPIPHTRECTDSTVVYYTVPSISTSVNDTLIFLAISYRLAVDAVAVEKGWRARLLLVSRGKGLYRLSSSLMQSGFLYYLGMISFLLLNLVVMASPLVRSTVRHYILVNEYISFTNIMACGAFRHVALCDIRDSPTGLHQQKIIQQNSPM